MAPQPPNPPTTTAFAVAPIVMGQVWATSDGVEYIAEHDGVRISVLNPDGTPITSVLQTPEAAIALGKLIIHAAGTAIRDNITDTGRPAPLPERLARIQKGFDA